MYSTHHAAISLVVGGLTVYALEPISMLGYELPPVAALSYAIALGVLIDLDHFLLARLRTGTWDAVRFCLSNPAAVIVDQGRIFEPGDVGVLPRLLSHLLVGGGLVVLLALESVGLAILTAVVCYAHLVSDVAWDLRRIRRATDVSATQFAD